MKIYIPFNMIIDTDFGIIRLMEEVQNIDKYSVNKLKSFLLKRENENPIPEYSKLRGIDVSEYAYELILERYYNKVLPLSMVTDMISFIINTYKLGLSSEVDILIGCDLESEMEFLKSITSSLKYPFEMELNMNVNLNDFDCIFTKYLDDAYMDYLLDNVKISGKRLYVADYSFNTLYDTESEQFIIDPTHHMRLESEGNIVCTVSLYNKKQNGGQ